MNSMTRTIRWLMAVVAVALVLSGLGAEVAEAKGTNPDLVNVVQNNPN